MKNFLIVSLISLVAYASEKNEKFDNGNPYFDIVTYVNTDTKGHRAFACVTTSKEDGTILNTTIKKNNLLWTSFDGQSQEQISSNIPLIMWTWLEKRYKDTHLEEKQ